MLVPHKKSAQSLYQTINRSPIFNLIDQPFHFPLELLASTLIPFIQFLFLFYVSIWATISNFLQTFYQKIRDQDNFAFIISIIPSMMAGLRHIWTMSSYYCSDEHMLTLLSKISNIFIIKVKNIIDLEQIFR